MKKVDILFSADINHIGGPMGTMKRILKNKEYFESRGYQVSIFEFGSISKGPLEDISQVPLANAVTSRNSVGSILFSLKRKMVMNLKLLTDLALRKKYGKVRKLVDYYLSLNRDPDIVQLHSHYDGAYYLSKRKNKKPKCVVFMHCNGIPYDQEQCTYPLMWKTHYFKYLKSICDWMVTQVDKIVFIAKIGQINFLKIYPNRSTEDTIVIRNGIDDLDKIQRNEVQAIQKQTVSFPFKYRLCTVGTISFRKGQKLLIESLHSLPKELLKDIHIDFVGEGGERQMLQNLVVKYGLDKNVEFCGSIPNTEVHKYLARNNIYVLMSKNEGLPMSILEAMRVGLPIIGTNAAGIPECIDDGYNGFLLDYEESQLTSMLKKLPEYNWEELGKNSYVKFKKEFTFERMKREFCDMYDNVLANEVRTI